MNGPTDKGSGRVFPWYTLDYGEEYIKICETGYAQSML